MFALSANSAGDALNESQRTAQTNGTGGITSALTDNAGQATLGKAVAGGMNEMSEWLKQRYSQTFDTVYVPPGAKLVVHITQRLAIDYETTGRKVRYGFSEPVQRHHQEALD
ncbi:integrating conjugative element protein [Xenorhabdus indica]|nr:integrating conjugative element protein [Xenorhabdus indica]